MIPAHTMHMVTKVPMDTMLDRASMPKTRAGIPDVIIVNTVAFKGVLNLGFTVA